MTLSRISMLRREALVVVVLALLFSVVVVALASCRATVTSPEGPAVEAVVMSDHVRQHVAVDEPEPEPDIAAHTNAADDGRPLTPTSPATDLAPQSTDLALGGLLCCSASVCVVPGPADCHHRVLWCDRYTLTLDATAGIYVAHCENERTTPP